MRTLIVFSTFCQSQHEDVESHNYCMICLNYNFFMDSGLSCLCVPLQAGKNGATGVELDLEFSADGVPILMHDETVDRTTNGSGPLSRLRFSELLKLDAAAKHRLRYGRGMLPAAHTSVQDVAYGLLEPDTVII